MEIYQNLSLEDLPNEVWKDIPNYEGLYQVSNLGRVKMMSRVVMANKSKRKISEHIIKQIKNPKGYLAVDLWRNNGYIRFMVHRIVLYAFVGIPQDSYECNHRNQNRSDNRVVNLEWITHKENLNYGDRTTKHRKTMTNHQNLSKRVMQYDLNGDFIAEYPSLREAGRQLGFSISNIKECCKGRYKSTHGYIFRYK